MQAAYDAIAEWYDQTVRTVDPVSMLSTYLNTLIHCGFHVAQMIEPQPVDAATAPPGYQIVPLFMLIKSVKNGP